MYKPLLCSSAPLLLCCPAASRAADVTYLDRASGKVEKVAGVDLEESVQGITFKRGGKAVGKVSALDVRDVTYSEGEIKPVSISDYIKPGGKLREAALPTRAAERPKLSYPLGEAPAPEPTG